MRSVAQPTHAVQYNAKYCTHVMSIGVTSGQYGKLHTSSVYMYAKATEALLELRHRQYFYSVKAVGELPVLMLQFIKAGRVSVRRLDSKM